MKKILSFFIIVSLLLPSAYSYEGGISDFLVSSYLRGMMYLNKGDLQGAVEEFEKAKTRDMRLE